MAPCRICRHREPSGEEDGLCDICAHFRRIQALVQGRALPPWHNAATSSLLQGAADALAAMARGNPPTRGHREGSRSRSRSPFLGERIGEAANPGPPDHAACRRDRTLHALAQMALCRPAAPAASDAETLSDTLSAHTPFATLREDCASARPVLPPAARGDAPRQCLITPLLATRLPVTALFRFKAMCELPGRPHAPDACGIAGARQNSRRRVTEIRGCMSPCCMQLRAPFRARLHQLGAFYRTVASAGPD